MKILTTTILSLLTVGGSLLQATPGTADLRSPEAIETKAPEVPANYARWGLPGHVVIEFRIAEDGRTEAIRLVDYSDRLYASRVEEAVRGWRFEKPRIAGVTYRLPFTFSPKFDRQAGGELFVSKSDENDSPRLR
jgi:TonB family protein